MAIKVTGVASNRPDLGSDVQGFTCQLIGDDVSTSFVLNLSKAPFDFKFDVVPDSVDLVMDGIEGLPDVTGVVSTNEAGDVLLTCSLTGPLPSISGHIEDNAQNFLTGKIIYNV